LTGGRDLFAPTSSALMGLYITVSEQLKNQYAIQYDSANPGKAETPLSLVVKVNRAGVTQQDEKGFTIPAGYQPVVEEVPPPPEASNLPLILGIVGGIVVIGVIVVLLIVKGRTKPAQLICPNCGREMMPEWTECLFCASKEEEEVPEPEEPQPELEEEAASDTVTPDTLRIQPVEPPAAGESARSTVKLQTIQRHLAYLITKEGTHVGRQHQLKEGETTLGREEGNDIILDDDASSRQHAKVRLEEGTFVIRDLATTNGTFVNDEQIVDQPLKDGDLVRIGETVFTFKQVADSPDAEESTEEETPP